MRTFKRVHNTGTEAIVTEHTDEWRMQINVREPGRNPMTMTGYMAPTVELAKEIADKEVANTVTSAPRHVKTGLKFTN
jgi:hypothetical protein